MQKSSMSSEFTWIIIYNGEITLRYVLLLADQKENKMEIIMIISLLERQSLFPEHMTMESNYGVFPTNIHKIRKTGNSSNLYSQLTSCIL